MRQVLSGAVLVILGIAAFIEAHAHRPTGLTAHERTLEKLYGGQVPESELSETAYDLLRIGAWALVIIGGLLVITGLIRYWRALGS